MAFIVISFVPFQARSQSANSQLLYSPTTADYLVKAYWALGKLDLAKDSNIDQYLMVTECDLFNQYFKNDIEWTKIRNATRGYIEANKKSFPTRFEFIQPIDLNRYDPASGEFSLAPKSQFIGIGALQVSGNAPTDYRCTQTGNFDERVFPLNAVLNLSRPFNLTKIDVSQATASEYIKYLQEHDITDPNTRPAYIRFRFKVEQNLAPVYIRNGQFANFFGMLESVTVFGDKGLFIKMQEIKY